MSGESIVSFSAAAADSISSSTKTHIDNNTTITESGQQQKKVAAAENNIYVTWSDTTFPEVDVLFRKSTDGGNTFGSTINLSNNPAVSVDPRIAAAGTIVYIIWQDRTHGNFDVFFRRSTDGGNTFGSTINLSNNRGNSFNPHIAAAGTNVYIVWDDDTPGNNDVFFRRSTDSGNTFGSTINLSNDAGDSFVAAFDSNIAIAGTNVYIIWQDGTPGNADMFFRKSTDGGNNFGSTINLSNDAGGSVNPYIAAADRNVYVIWTDNTPGNLDILFRKSTNNGNNFGSTINLSNDPVDSSFPQLSTLSGTSAVYVTWVESLSVNNADMFFRRSTDGGNNFGSTINLSNDAGDSGTQHMEAAGTNVYIIWLDDTPGNNDVFFRRSTDSGNTFGSTINLSNDPGGSSISHIAAAGTNVYIIWDDGTSGNGGILLRKSTNNGNNFGSTINLSSHPSRAFDPQIAIS